MQTKHIIIQRGNNIGKAIKDSFDNYHRIKIKTLDIGRDVLNKVNTATVTFTL